MLFAHFGKIDAAGATKFGWMTLAMALMTAVGVVAARIRKREKPCFSGLVAGIPFAVVSLCSFGFALACRFGAPPQRTWTTAIVAIAATILALTPILPKPRRAFTLDEMEVPARRESDS